MSDEALNDQIADLVNAITRSLENMFNIPLNYTIFDFADIWLKVPENKRHAANFDFTTQSHSTHIVCALSITPTSGVSFPFEEMDTDLEIENEEDLLIDTYFLVNKVYTYGEFLSVLYSAARKLYVLLQNNQDVVFCQTMLEACMITFESWLAFRPDVVNKMPQLQNITAIMQTVDAWSGVTNLLSNDEEEDD